MNEAGSSHEEHKTAVFAVMLACRTCHIINDRLEARAAILWGDDGVEEGQAGHLYLCAAC